MERGILKKLRAFSPGAMANIRIYKESQRDIPIGKMCSVFNVSRARHYSWLKSTPSNRLKENQIIEQQIAEAFKDSPSA